MSARSVVAADRHKDIEIMRQMSALDFARLVQVALGKVADEHDWQVIHKSNCLLEEQWQRGFEAGRKQGIAEALSEAEAPMQQCIDRAMRRS